MKSEIKINNVTYCNNGDGTYTAKDELHQTTLSSKEIQIYEVLSFMQRNDKTGFDWIRWFEEILAGESNFDKVHVIETLSQWSDDIADVIRKVEAI